ncbi:MAG: 2-hydroxyacyl-CoA dehydratase [Ruminococcus sp.]|nr:2-hydroxyacyl-CoA dehydratase [Ruminococcus sp.]
MAVAKAEYVQFTKEMRRDYTILVPTMLPIHFKLISNVLVRYGYKIDFLENVDGNIKESGLRYVHNDTCYPALLVIGQLINAVESGRYDKDKVALLITQTGGGCRASNYIYLLRKALKKAGYGHIPVISLNFNMLEKHPGFQITLPMLYRMFYCAFYGDLMMLMANQCRPYEKNKGETDRMVKKWVNRLLDESAHSSTMRYSHVKENYRLIADDFNKILGDTPRDKVKVGIVGEIYVKFSPLGNNNLEQFLLKEGVEPVVPGFVDFCLYCVYNGLVDYDLYRIRPFKAFGSKFLYRFLLKKQRYIRKMMQEYYPSFMPMADFDETQKRVKGYINQGAKMGEGWLLTAEMLELISEGVGNIICTQPFGCLPNHIAGKGMMKPIKERNPGVNIVAIDYDPGATAINQENRIKLMLSNAER